MRNTFSRHSRFRLSSRSPALRRSPWRRAVGSQRDAAAFAGTMMAMATVAALELESPTGRVAAFAVVGLAALGMHSLRPSRSWLFMGFLAVVVSCVLSATALLGRPV